MKKKWTWAIAVIVIILLIAIALILRQANNSSKDNNGYDTYKVEKESPLNLEGKASPKSVKTYNNNSQLGTYVSTQVDDGQSVKEGDPLINYEINNNKRQQLIDKVDSAKNENERAEAQQQLNQYDRQVNDSIYAAFDGKIDIKNTDHVSDGEPILQLVGDEPQIKATVTEFDLGKIKEGDQVDVKVTSTGKKGKGEIQKISELPKSYEERLNKGGSGAVATDSSSEEGGGTQASNPVSDPSSGEDSDTSKYTIVINNIDIPVRAGYSTDVEVPLDAIKLPKSVLTKDNNVFVVGKGNKVEKRDIKIDKVNGEIFVKEGLKTGDKLIKNPKKSMNDGDKVEVSSW